VIVVFGSINVDLVTTMARFPRSGETVVANHVSQAPGGKGANQSLAARRAGAKVKLIGVVGTDHFAKLALSLVDEAGVDVSAIRVGDTQTGNATILVDENGNNAIAVVAGANGSIDDLDVERAFVNLNTADVLLLQMEIPATPMRKLIDRAREKGVTTILNLAPYTDDAITLAPLADILILNEHEFTDLSVGLGLKGADLNDLLQSAHVHLQRTLVVTLGERGVIAKHGNQIYRAAGLPVSPVDTIGAGDTFCGYFAASLEAGNDFQTALDRAAAAGSLACLETGGQSGIPAIDDVLRAIGVAA
jgi:ribokinase